MVHLSGPCPRGQLENREDFEGRGHLPGLYRVTVQPLERWGGSVQPPHELAQLYVFVYADPCLVDFLRLSGCSRDARGQMRRWSSVPSDLEGTLCLESPQPVAPQLPLGDPGIPPLCMLEAAVDAGWRPAE